MAGAVFFNIVMYGSGFLLSLLARVLSVAAPGRVPAVALFWSRIVLWALRMFCGGRVLVSGAENLPRAGGALIAARHQSALDIFIWISVLARPAFVLKKELTRIPLFGPSLAPGGMIVVDRAGGAASLRAMLEDCRAALAAGRQIVIFPEGTRVPPAERATLQPGIVALSRVLARPVIPAATDTGRVWGRGQWNKRPGVARLEIASPLPAGLPRGELLAALARHFYDGEQDGQK